MKKIPQTLFIFDELSFDAQARAARQELQDYLDEPDLDPENDAKWIESLRQSQALSDKELVEKVIDDGWIWDFIYFADGTRATKYEELAKQEEHRIQDELIAKGIGFKTTIMGLSCVSVPCSKMEKPMQQAWKRLNKMAYEEKESPNETGTSR